MIGFREDAQNGKSSSGALDAKPLKTFMKLMFWDAKPQKTLMKPMLLDAKPLKTLTKPMFWDAKPKKTLRKQRFSIESHQNHCTVPKKQRKPKNKPKSVVVIF